MSIETSLPDLPFTNHGEVELLFNSHSAARSTPRAYPRTDLGNLTTWASFPNEVHQAIQSATTSANLSSIPFHISAWTDTGYGSDEESLRSYAAFALHTPVQKVLQKLGVNGSFVFLGSGPNFAIVGSPDFSWIASNERPHPKLIVEYKTWWAADLRVVAAPNSTLGAALNQDSLDALQQVYGYMTFNDLKFGILANWDRALFLRRAETHDCKTLEYYLVELDGHDEPMSMLKAWVGMVLLAESDWFYASPTPSSAPPNQMLGNLQTAWSEQETAIRDAGNYHMLPADGTYQPRSLDFRLCHFERSSARDGANGCVVNARLSLLPSRLLPVNCDLQVVCKVVDVVRYPSEADSLSREARAYAALHNLQGEVIPRLYGFYNVWGILRLLALEPVGEAIIEGKEITPEVRNKMRGALQRIHHAGFLHGDVARRNFCRTRKDEIFLVDLENCRPGNALELRDEMNVVEGL